MTLVEFLTARLDDDERAARAVEPLGYSVDMGGTRRDEHFTHGRMGYASEDGMPRRLPDGGATAHFVRHDPARVLREVEAKRRIIEAERHEWAEMDYAIRCLAAVYSDHSDYRDGWRP